MAQEFAFRGMEVYGLARAVAAQAVAIAARLTPPQWPVGQQFVRAALSIMLNIAEGSGEFRSREKARFYRMARRSSYECAAIVDHLQSSGTASVAEAAALDRTLTRVAASLTALALRMESRIQ
jgi:four helix bundle protein